MSDELQIPSKPWGEAEIAFLTANVDLLSPKTKAELGIGKEKKEEDKVTVTGTPGYEARKPELTPAPKTVDNVDADKA